MAPSAAPSTVQEPFPISLIANRYLLFSIDIISHVRRNHNMCGMLIGTIPNLSQQNVFLGIPLELMPEEARVLVEKGAAYVVNDEVFHKKTFSEMSRGERLKWLQEMDRRGDEVTSKQEELKEKRKDAALKGKGLREEVSKHNESVPETAPETAPQSTASDDSLRTEPSSFSLGFIMKGSKFSDSWVEVPTKPESSSFSLGLIMKGSNFSDTWVEVPAAKPESSTEDDSLFDTPTPSPAPASVPLKSGTPRRQHFVTPTTSYPPLPNPPSTTSTQLPEVPKSFPLFRYLHSLGYYHMPGLRFGCHYNSYPGDPLRYHSHFAATGLAWDDEFELLDIVGGGRLATGTKKAYMIGGEDVDAVQRKGKGKVENKAEKERDVRAFSIEWAGM